MIAVGSSFFLLCFEACPLRLKRRRAGLKLFDWGALLVASGNLRGGHASQTGLTSMMDIVVQAKDRLATNRDITETERLVFPYGHEATHNTLFGFTYEHFKTSSSYAAFPIEL